MVDEWAAIEDSLHGKIGRLTMELDWLKKRCNLSNAGKRQLIEPAHKTISISRQCELLGLARSSYYFREASESALNLTLMKLIDEEYTRHPFKASRKMAFLLKEIGHDAKNGHSSYLSEAKS